MKSVIFHTYFYTYYCHEFNFILILPSYYDVTQGVLIASTFDVCFPCILDTVDTFYSFNKILTVKNELNRSSFIINYIDLKHYCYNLVDNINKCLLSCHNIKLLRENLA